MLVRTLLGLGAIAVAVGAVFLAKEADATLYVRRSPTDIIPPDWVGKWNCNIDGRSAVLELSLVDTTICEGGVCRTTSGTGIAGRFSNNGGAWMPIEQRDFAPGDPSTSRRDHMLPLRYNNTDNWMLMIHTWNRNFASGYTTWNGIHFGLQCRKF